MPQDLVLLTGATAFVGFRILTELLDHRYKIRLVIRSESKIGAINSALPSKYNADALDFIIVPDMVVDGAFDTAVQGISYIVHVASPIPAPSDDLEAKLVKPAVEITMSLLNSAIRETAIKKIVITSSIAAVVPTVPKVFDADNVEPDPTGPYTHPFWAYVASKKLAFNATRRFIAEKNPHFSVINVMPSFVVGPNRFATTTKEYLAGSNIIPLSPLTGAEYPEPVFGTACHIDDVAVVHVAALRPEVSGHQNFGVTYNGPSGIEWNDVAEIVKKKLPDIVASGVFPFGSSLVTQPLPFEASKTESVLGIKFKNFEDMVVDLAKEYARLVSAAPSE